MNDRSVTSSPYRFIHWSIILILFCYFGVSATNGYRATWETGDGYDFIVESHNAQTLQAHGGINWERPRTLVTLMLIFDRGYHALTSHLPDLSGYHVLMALITTLTYGAWYWASMELLGPFPAAAATLFVLLWRITYANSFQCLSDNLAGLFFALVIIVIQKTPPNNIFESKLLNRVLLGFFLTLVALSKHQEFIFPFFYLPVLIASLWIVTQKRPFPSIRALLWWMADIGLVWAATTECFYRITSHGNEGVVTYVRYLIQKCLWALSSPELNSKMTYVIELHQAFGILLWITLLIVSLGYLYHLFRKSNPLFFVPSASKANFLTAFIVTLFFLVLNVRIPNRESRYLLPLLPMLIATFCKVGMDLSQSLTPRVRKVGLTLVVLVFAQPAWTTGIQIRNDWQRTHNRLYSVGEVNRFWEYLSSSVRNASCKQIFTCTSWSYDGGPGAYRLYTGMSPRTKFCPDESKPEQVEQLLKDAPEVGDCYVLKRFSQTAPPMLEIKKILGSGISDPNYISQTFFN